MDLPSKVKLAPYEAERLDILMDVSSAGRSVQPIADGLGLLWRGEDLRWVGVASPGIPLSVADWVGRRETTWATVSGDVQH